MDTNTVVLFVNHLQHNCGVYQFFEKMTRPVVASNPNYYYIETNNEWEHDYWINQLNPDIVVYNFYFSGSTMPWLSNHKIASQKSRFKQLCLYHEGSLDDKGFDLILHQNPYNEDTKYINLPRSIPHYTGTLPINAIPVIGTFGFGLGGKGFTRVVETVVNEFDIAIIRMNIPFAYFGDSSGDGARWWANACHALTRPGIDLQITHTLLDEQDLLTFLAGNDINCFFYDANLGRGLSGTLDYALAVNRPIAITYSDQFKHMWNDKHMIEKNTLRGIISQGTEHLQQYHALWNDTSMIDTFNKAFYTVLGR